MKLAALVSVFLKEEKCKHFSQKQGQNFINVLCYWAHAVQQVCKFQFVYFLLCGMGNWTCYYV